MFAVPLTSLPPAAVGNADDADNIARRYRGRLRALRRRVTPIAVDDATATVVYKTMRPMPYVLPLHR